MRVILWFLFYIYSTVLYANDCVKDPCLQLDEKFQKLSEEMTKGMQIFATSELNSMKVTDENALERALELSRLYELNKSNSDIVNELLCNTPYKHPHQKARHKVDKKVYLRDNVKTSCNFSKLIEAGLEDEESFVKAIRETNFSPCCIPKMSLSSISSTDKHISGFAVGYEFGGGAGPFGIDVGREVIFIQVSQTEFDVAIVTYKGLETSVGLPVGVSTTQGVLTGRCDKVGDYLGVFSGFDFGGIQINTGLDKSTLNPSRKATGCNSESIISGATTDLIGINENRYELSSKIVRVKGPRLKKLIKFFEESNTRGVNRKLASKKRQGTLSYLKDDFKRRISGDDNFFEDPVLKECSYSLDKQIKDFASIK
jgi:hypothetical protein